MHEEIVERITPAADAEEIFASCAEQKGCGLGHSEMESGDVAATIPKCFENGLKGLLAGYNSRTPFVYASAP